MAGERTQAARSLIAHTSPRALFAELVGGALQEIGPRPSPMATTYLIELLDERVRAPEPEEGAREGLLAEALLAARLAEGAERIAQLHRLGDRSLFLAGFFGDSLCRGRGNRSYCAEVGRSAYAGLSTALASTLAERTWPRLFEELADRFPDFADVLSEVCEHVCPRGSEALVGLHRRYVESGSECDRRRLLRRGRNLPRRADGERWQ
jgi:hypothetical protein